MPYSPDEIFEAARSIRPYLAELLGLEEGQKIDQQLSDLLNHFPEESTSISQQIFQILISREPTREWTKNFLQDNLTPESYKSFQPTLSPIPSGVSGLVKYACPHGDYIYYQRQIGEQIPLCPTHKIPLQRID